MTRHTVVRKQIKFIFVFFLTALLCAGCSKNSSNSNVGGAHAPTSAGKASGVKTKDGSDSADLAISKVGVDPCTLLTATEVKSVLATVPLPRRKVETLTAPAADCDWENDTAILGVRVNGPGSASTFDKLLDKDSGKPITGVGDKARWNQRLGSLDFVRGDRLYTIQLVGKGKDVNVVSSLANGLLSRL